MGELAGLLEDELDEALEEGAALEEGTEKVVLNEGGIAFKHAGFLDRSELAGVKVVVVDTLFPWWACVLGKTGAKVEGICLCFISPWFGVATSYFTMFGIKGIGIARLTDVGGLSGVHSMFLDCKPTRESRWLTHVGPPCVISAKGLSVSPSRYSTSWLPVSHCSLGGVTNLQGRVCVLSRVCLKCGRLGISQPPPSPMPRILGGRVLFLRPGVIPRVGYCP